MSKPYQPKTGQRCHCKPGVHRSNCPDCEGTGWEIDFAAIRERRAYTPKTAKTAPPCNCPTCGKPAKFIRDRAFRDGSGLVFTCTNRTCEGQGLYFYPQDQDPRRDV